MTKQMGAMMEIGSILIVVDEGEVEGEPKQHIVVVSTDKSILNNESKAIGMSQVLLQAVELLVNPFTYC